MDNNIKIQPTHMGLRTRLNFDVVRNGRMLESDMKSKLRFCVKMIACYGKQMAVATLSMQTVVWVTC
eukprot:4205391-Pleurochrysis_carterae.AAC.1